MTKKATFAGGCFWGLEELIRKEPGVINTRVGYTGGKNENPIYENHAGSAGNDPVTGMPRKISPNPERLE